MRSPIPPSATRNSADTGRPSRPAGFQTSGNKKGQSCIRCVNKGMQCALACMLVMQCALAPIDTGRHNVHDHDVYVMWMTLCVCMLVTQCVLTSVDKGRDNVHDHDVYVNAMCPCPRRLPPRGDGGGGSASWVIYYYIS